MAQEKLGQLDDAMRTAKQVLVSRFGGLGFGYHDLEPSYHVFAGGKPDSFLRLRSRLSLLSHAFYLPSLSVVIRRIISGAGSERITLFERVAGGPGSHSSGTTNTTQTDQLGKQEAGHA